MQCCQVPLVCLDPWQIAHVCRACMLIGTALCRLEDVIHDNNRLYLVFEFLDLDLKKHMDSNPEICKDHRLVKVRSHSWDCRDRAISSSTISGKLLSLHEACTMLYQVYLHQMLQGITYCHAHRSGPAPCSHAAAQQKHPSRKKEWAGAS